MKTQLAILIALMTSVVSAENVYVESPTDTDLDGKPDRIFPSVRTSRPRSIGCPYPGRPASIVGGELRSPGTASGH